MQLRQELQLLVKRSSRGLSNKPFLPNAVVYVTARVTADVSVMDHDAVALAGMKFSGSSNRSRFRSSCRSNKRFAHI